MPKQRALSNRDGKEWVFKLWVFKAVIFCPFPPSTFRTVGPHGGGGPRCGAAPGGPPVAVNQPAEAVGGDCDAGAAVAEPAEEEARGAAGQCVLTVTPSAL